MKKRIFALKLIIGIAILAFVVYKIGIGQLSQSFSQFNPFYMIPILAAYGIQIILGGMRLDMIIRPMGKVISILKLCKYHLLSWSVGLFIPGKVGEFSIIYLLRKEGIPLGKGTAVAIVEKITTLIALGLIALSGFLLFFTIKEAVMLVIVLVALGVGFVATVTNKHVRRFVRKYILRKYDKLFSGFYSTLKKLLRDYGLLTKVTIISIIKWIVGALPVYFAFLSLGATVPFWLVVVITAITVIISLIPISISGLGIKEGAAVILYSNVGIEGGFVLASHLIVLAFNYGIAILTIGGLFDLFLKSKETAN